MNIISIGRRTINRDNVTYTYYSPDNNSTRIYLLGGQPPIDLAGDMTLEIWAPAPGTLPTTVPVPAQEPTFSSTGPSWIMAPPPNTTRTVNTLLFDKTETKGWFDGEMWRGPDSFNLDVIGWRE